MRATSRAPNSGAAEQRREQQDIQAVLDRLREPSAEGVVRLLVELEQVVRREVDEDRADQREGDTPAAFDRGMQKRRQPGRVARRDTRPREDVPLAARIEVVSGLRQEILVQHVHQRLDGDEHNGEPHSGCDEAPDRLAVRGFDGESGLRHVEARLPGEPYVRRYRLVVDRPANRSRRLIRGMTT
jgi:hypothetical protein